MCLLCGTLNFGRVLFVIIIRYIRGFIDVSFYIEGIGVN